MSSELKDVRPIEGALFGTLFLGAGLMILFVALEWIHVDPASIHAPRWVLGVCGVMFMIPGIAALSFGARNALGGSARSGRRAQRRAPARLVLLRTRDRGTTQFETLAGAPDHAHESV